MERRGKKKKKNIGRGKEKGMEIGQEKKSKMKGKGK